MNILDTLLDIKQSGSIADWAICIITLGGFIIALFQLKSYRKEMKMKMFIEMRQRFKSDQNILEVLEYLSNTVALENVQLEPNRYIDNNYFEIPSIYKLYHFLGFYEELDKIREENIVSIEDIEYFFGYYLILFMRHNELVVLINQDSPYWQRVYHLYGKMHDLPITRRIEEIDNPVNELVNRK